MRFFTKRVFLATSVFLTLFFVFIFLLGTKYCYNDLTCRQLRKTFSEDFLIFTALFPILLIISIITHFLSTSVFEAWKKFAVWAIPVLLVLTYLVTRDTGGSNFFTMDFSLYFLAIIYGLFFLSSLIVIGIATTKSK